MYIWYKDPKVILGAIDTLIGLILYFIGKYGTAGLLEDIKTVFIAIQPMIVIIIGGIFQTQQAALKVGRKLSAFNVPD